MKLATLSLSGLFLLSTGLIAAEPAPTLKITSFRYAGRDTYAAELCGKITGLNAATNVQIVSDEGTSAPGTYYARAGKDGNFCHVIVSYRGRVSASIVRGDVVSATDSALAVVAGDSR